MSVRVVARIRPLLGAQELDKDVIVRADSSEPGKPHNVVKIPSPKNLAEEFSFTFGSVYDMPTTQEDLFTNESAYTPSKEILNSLTYSTVAPHMKALFQGLDLTIFAYGVTGTGKTHTMRGGTKLADRGVIPRLLSAVYRRGRKVTKDSNGATKVAVTLSYYEIYNDKVFDLFEPIEKRTPSGLPLREKDGKTIVVGLSEHSCHDLKDFERLYIEANNNRSTGATKLNAQSSRSHAILMVKLTQTTGDETKISTASAIDLAGSEDNRRTENGKERMIESAAINKSLFVLSQCVDAIGRGDKRIPYRESKMTRILSLGQNDGITIMILNLAPLKSYHLDTLSSLNVSSRAKRIEVREIENEIVFKQQPRTTAGLTMNRQPLRAKDQNVIVASVNTAAKDKAEKQAKAFSVFADKRLSGSKSIYVQQTTRSTAGTKRPSDHNMSSRPSKMSRSNPTVQHNAMSAAQIEQMVERKVAEVLAAKATDMPAAGANDSINETVQRRLEALERKIESGNPEDARAEGLRFLLMAKQHKERGEDASALKMYQLAEPFFPHQEKLQRKMQALRQKIQLKREERLASEIHTQPEQGAVQTIQLITPAASFDGSAISQTWKNTREHEQPEIEEDLPEDNEADHSIFIAEQDPESDYESTNHKPASKTKAPKLSKTKTHISQDSSTSTSKFDTELTPRGKHLLDIVNSRSFSQIKGLNGVGVKKAKDLVEFLELHDGESIGSLKELMNVPGLGGKTVERMYEGIGSIV